MFSSTNVSRFPVVAGLSLLAALMAPTLGVAAPAKSAPVAKTNLPPSAVLHYNIDAQQSGLKISGDTDVKWLNAGSKYSVEVTTSAMLVGKILEEKSAGGVDRHGLVPVTFTEKRFRKSATTATFNRDSKTVSFSHDGKPVPIKGGEQDRASAIWQLVATARANSAKFKPGSTWTMPVLGRRDVSPWVFKVVKQEKVATAMGSINAWKIKKMPHDAKEQAIDVWLAPSHQWYPVRLRYTEPDGDYIDQTLQKIDKK